MTQFSQSAVGMHHLDWKISFPIFHLIAEGEKKKEYGRKENFSSEQSYSRFLFGKSICTGSVNIV